MRKLAALTAIFIVVVSFAAAGAAIYIENANQNAALRTFICFFQERVLASPSSTRKQKQQAVKFFSDALAQLHDKPCRSDR